MSIWFVILFAGLGTYLMRSGGIFYNKNWGGSSWLDHIRIAVLLVMVVDGLFAMTRTQSEFLAMFIASLVTLATSMARLPLVVRMLFGCVVYGIVIR